MLKVKALMLDAGRRLIILEPRDTFVIPLKSQRVDERGTTVLECDVNDKDADVQWWHDGVRGSRGHFLLSYIQLEAIQL